MCETLTEGGSPRGSTPGLVLGGKTPDARSGFIYTNFLFSQRKFLHGFWGTASWYEEELGIKALQAL